MSLDSEVPPSKYLDQESRENTKLLKSLATKSSSASNGLSSSHKFKSIVNKVQNCQEGLAEVDKNCQEGFAEVDKKIDTITNKVQEGLDGLDSKIKVVEAKTRSSVEMKEMKAELYLKLEAITAATDAATTAATNAATTAATTAQIPNTKKFKEVDVAVIELFKKMAYIESIVLNLSKSYYEMNDKDLKNLISNQSTVEKVSVTSNTASRTNNNETLSQTATNVTPNSSSTKPLPIPMPTSMPDKAKTKENPLKGGTPSYSLRRTPQIQNHSIDYEI